MRKPLISTPRADLDTAQKFLASLRPGDQILMDQQTSPITVTRELHQADGFGAWESAQVNLSYGVGRYSTSVSVARLAAGFVTMRKA